jgi:hypothetical protein
MRWLGPPHTQITLEIDLRGHGCQILHGEHARIHSVFVGMHHPAVKCCVPLPFSLGDWNYSLLQFSLACCGAVQMNSLLSPCLLIAHHMVHFAGWMKSVQHCLDFHRAKILCSDFSQAHLGENEVCFEPQTVEPVRLLPYKLHEILTELVYQLHVGFVEHMYLLTF